MSLDLTNIPSRVPPDSPLVPQWYRLGGRSGEKLWHDEVMLAIWIGTQVDEAFPEAWHSDEHSLPPEGVSNTRSKVYYSPKLMYLKVVAIAAHDVRADSKGGAYDRQDPAGQPDAAHPGFKNAAIFFKNPRNLAGSARTEFKNCRFLEFKFRNFKKIKKSRKIM
jgi:hypothetical protein